MKRRQTKKELKKKLVGISEGIVVEAEPLDIICEQLANHGVHTAFIGWNYSTGKFNLHDAIGKVSVDTKKSYYIH